ncbi:uncharacterized protein DC041_0006448 [Schistosoma bovis]|uniref:Uncharacterized protein n=1 Tax=Schistosoma bovis TaxID=6184 RepID=A0A430Q3U6_SCHBO|nr:uncharacterized protein DC041_0006448 [Schistosoma bovis]
MTVRQIAERLAGYFSATSLTISMQDGEDAGQSVSLQSHDKVRDRVYRSHDVMSAEAKQLRQLYYQNTS